MTGEHLHPVINYSRKYFNFNILSKMIQEYLTPPLSLLPFEKSFFYNFESNFYWSTGRLVYWSTGLLVYWSTGLLVYWSSGLLVYWSTGLLVYWSTELLVYWSILLIQNSCFEMRFLNRLNSVLEFYSLCLTNPRELIKI